MALITNTIKSATTSPPVVKNSGGTEVGKFCRVYAFFTTVTTTTLLGGFNVSSLTDNGTGDTTVNFASSLSGPYYSASSMPNTAQAVTTFRISQLAGSLRFGTGTLVGSYADSVTSLTIVGDQ